VRRAAKPKTLSIIMSGRPSLLSSRTMMNESGDRPQFSTPDVLAISNRLGVKTRHGRDQLSLILRSLPGLVDAFKHARFQSPPSKIAEFLSRVRRDPAAAYRAVPLEKAPPSTISIGRCWPMTRSRCSSIISLA